MSPLRSAALASIVGLLGCSEVDAGATTTSSGAPQPSSSDGGDSRGGSSTGADPCAGPFEFGPPAAWTSYGKDPANTRANPEERALDPTSIACVGERWRVEGLAGVTSTPAVVAGRIYFGDWTGTLHARASSDGAALWTRPLGAQINDSPLVTAESVYIGDFDGRLHAVARDSGELRWSVELDPHPDAAIYGSPILADGRVVIGVASVELAALKDDYSFRGSIVALDADDGHELWRTYTTEDDESGGAGVSVWSTAAFDAGRGRIYIGTGNTYEPPAAPLSDGVLALAADTGAIVWSRQLTADDVYTIFMPPPQGADADVGAAPNLFRVGERDVVGVGDKAGVYSVLDRDDGATVWATRLTPGSHLGGVMTTAALGDRAIVVASNTWQGDQFDFGSDANTSSLFGLDRETGTVLWQRPLAHPSFGAITMAGELAYVTTIDGTVHAVDAALGIEVWSVQPGAATAGGVTIVDGAIHVGYGFWFFTAPAMPTGGLVTYTLPHAG